MTQHVQSPEFLGRHLESRLNGVAETVRTRAFLPTGLTMLSNKSTVVSLVAAVAASFMPLTEAYAQEPDTEYNVERFRLSTDRGGILDVELAEVMPHLQLELSAWLGYSNDPLVVYRDTADGRVREGAVVSDRLGGNLLAAIGLFDRFEIGVAIPLIFVQENELGDFMSVSGSVSSFGIGDIRLHPKVVLLRGDLSVSLALGLTLPTSSSSDYFGDGQVTFAPELLVAKRFGSKTRAGLNVGYRVRENREALDLNVNDEIYAHVGVGHMVTERLELDGTFSIATAAADFFDRFNSNHSELRVGAGYHVANFVPFAAAGLGTSEGFGTPDWRLLLGVRLGFPRNEPIDRLIVDTDGDGLPDDVDECDNEPETINGIEDDDGCPEVTASPLDSDGDGLTDDVDQCPSEPEDVDQFEDENGCPDPDNDNDGVLDSADDCPNEPGPVANRGCPDKDTDGDTVVDRVDNCPIEPGSVDNHGCKEKQLVVLKGNRLEILDRVFFRTNKAVIVRRSYRLLNNVAKVLNNHPEIAKIQVEGHTDDRGSDTSNKKLSQRRAASVRKYLIGKGVSGDRLEAIGYGEETPIATNDTNEGRSTNRRVEFNLGGAEGIDQQNSGPGGDTMDN